MSSPSLAEAVLSITTSLEIEVQKLLKRIPGATPEAAITIYRLLSQLDTKARSRVDQSFYEASRRARLAANPGSMI